MAVCACCRGEFAPSGRGRPPRFCSDACRFRSRDRVRTLRRRLAKLEHLAQVNREPWASGYARRAEVVRAALARLEGLPVAQEA